ncbi:MAG: prolipoprotein diacylglyceryl transferase [Micavibrio aeruginosavorus]|uniref:Phosphatidylglycerol--prolipoprotein diacylglyceryl transferase n=1 Tax=Micavibrio aeruginosavorus TaxID=349221 RepID=A0A2W5HB64_9BACT|nr:MAG: prolipoprotein diacylglyceryl transferase [Micavibrio aeruginosavorus]
MSLSFPNIDPVAIHLGPLAIHWYALAYLAGILGGWFLAKHIARLDQNRYRPNEADIDDFMTWAVLGVILGGRIGYILFYNFHIYAEHPLEVLKIWQGGMSWHGALIGVITVIISYAKIKKVELFRLADLFAVGATIGFFFGRIANFVNGELFGRVTESPFGIIFPRGGELPRHPSQLYEAALEGLVLFIILVTMAHISKIRNTPGLISAAFLFCYGCFRFIIEFFREPDAQLGFIVGDLSMGQLLCMPVIAGGILVFIIAQKLKARHVQPAT